MPKQRRARGAQWRLMDKPAQGEGVVIGYVRYSSINQDPRSIEEQKVRIEQKANGYGWRVARFAEEPEESASYDDLDSRPVFKSMLMNDAGTACNVIMCDETSRWARSEEIGYMSLRMLREKGCWWETASDDWDINKPLSESGSILWGIQLTQNASYSRKLSYHTKKGKMAKARDGYSNGIPMFGYRYPALVVNGSDTALDVIRTRRRIVYEPDLEYFNALVRLGELAAQQPLLSYREIADTLNSEGHRYKGSRSKIRSPWLNVNAHNLLRATYPREFSPGNGLGTIVGPDGALMEGLHTAAWPYRVWRDIEDNRILTGRRAPRYRKNAVAALQGVLVCNSCGRTMSYRETFNSRTRTDGSTYRHEWGDYHCYKFGERKCGSGKSGDGAFINSHMIESQFGVVLGRLGNLREDAIEFIKHVYEEEDPDDQKEFDKYDNQVQSLQGKRKRVIKSYISGDLTEDEKDAFIQDIDREIMRLPVPRRRYTDYQRDMDEAARICSLSGPWHDLTGNPALRHEIAKSIVERVVFDPSKRSIVGLKFLPFFHGMVAHVLSGDGWLQGDDGLLWNENPDVRTEVVRRFQYHDVIDLFRVKRDGVRAEDVAAHLSTSIPQANGLLRTLVSAGICTRTWHSVRRSRWYEYSWGGREVPQNIGSYRRASKAV